jgi:DNA-binding CsgD family transcriptional regulator/PAS domain-containing protein
VAAPRPARTTRPLTEDETREALVELLYQAATELDAWPTALDLLATWAHAACAAIVVRDRGEHAPRLWKQGGLPVMARGTIEAAGKVWQSTGQPDEIQTLGGPRAHVVGAFLMADERISATLVLQREATDVSFTRQELLGCAPLVAHVRRAFAIALRVQRLTQQRDGLASALDRIPVGVLLLARDGRVIRSNATARSITTARDGLAVVGGVLGTQSTGDAPGLRRLLRQACCDGEGPRSATVPAILHVARASLRRPYCVSASALITADWAFAADAPTAIVLISDPDTDVGPLTPIIREIYGLTPTEGQVATMLLQGTRVEEIATELDVSLNTVRTHLKRTFSKIGAVSQSDLVRVLLAGPARLVARDPRPDAYCGTIMNHHDRDGR